MNDANIQKVRKQLLRAMPDFQGFDNPPKLLTERELNYKHEAARKARSILQPFVDGDQNFTTGEQTRKVLSEVIELTNFLNWRDKSYIAEQLLANEGEWVEFGNLLVNCLQAIPGGDWQDALRKLLNWMEEKDCAYNLTKLLPTYFLFFVATDRTLCC